ncbi:MAG TPA: toll/interleukin-1 receptor domain-containing protein [Caulobacteraceae bacterium]|nr:toll/interleukin-1 receptor domain-containing protein [Caulobacteraceae bacterium]
MPHDVFISYSSKDKPVADRVCHALEAQGERCWIAPRDIPYGADWQEAIMSALAEASAMVLVFTGNTNESAHVRREVSAALEAGAIVIPLRTEEATPQGALRYNLINLHWMDAISPPLESHIADLIATLKRLRAAPDQTPPPAAAAPSPSITAAAPSPAPAVAGASHWRPTIDRQLEVVTGLALVFALLCFFSSQWILSLVISVPLIWRATYTRTNPTGRASRGVRLLASLAVMVISVMATSVGSR